ncbi:transmembrane channel-like protein [Plakobranchus ocellatus]|uniref:Transmembrane channel-like protein n=1 Tax=Plakobranchus ocellatus TaxID=259542 RepID=A0AAV3Z9T9_9GAST|nr:transmembrane channel-like protein [Plakobranchus ocellatus]
MTEQAKQLLVGSNSGSNTRKQVPESDREIQADLKTIWNAEGIVQYSPTFYGYYGNEDKIGQGYRLPLAYLVTGLAAFAFSFIVVLKTMAANSRQSRVSESSDEEYIFAWKLFTEWDYMIASNETATTKHASITTTFKVIVLPPRPQPPSSLSSFL